MTVLGESVSFFGEELKCTYFKILPAGTLGTLPFKPKIFRRVRIAIINGMK
jgi:hypothetical protein